MPYFSVSLNNKPWEIFGGNNFRFIEIGIISVGPSFDIDIVCNGLEHGKSEAISLLNEKLKASDVVRIVPLKNKTNMTDEYNFNQNASHEVKDKNDLKNPSRSFKVNVASQQDMMIKAAHDTSICLNCMWLAKDGKFKLSLGNTNYKDVEQWFQMNIDFDQAIEIIIA